MASSKHQQTPTVNISDMINTISPVLYYNNYLPKKWNMKKTIVTYFINVIA